MPVLCPAPALTTSGYQSQRVPTVKNINWTGLDWTGLEGKINNLKHVLTVLTVLSAQCSELSEPSQPSYYSRQLIDSPPVVKLIRRKIVKNVD